MTMMQNILLIAILSFSRPFLLKHTRPRYIQLRSSSLADFLESENTAADLKEVITALASSSIEIAEHLAYHPFSELVKTKSYNPSGEEQKSLDVLSDLTIQNNLRQKATSVRAYISEELSHILIFPRALMQDNLIVACDPLDGSSNIDCAVATGTIFSVLNSTSHDDSGLEKEILSKCDKSMIAAGYVMYSSSTELVITLGRGKGTHGFTLDRKKNEYFLTKHRMKCPERGAYYSLNEGRASDWPDGLRRYISNIKDGKGESGKKYSLRYICSLVADAHRTLLYGGWAANPRKHLRLLFEAAPIAFIFEEAGLNPFSVHLLIW